MKITIIGAGVQGSAIALLLAKNPDISEIVCSDISLDRAKRLANSLRSRKISAQKVDASKVDELLNVIKGADTVVNASLPKFNLKIMNAALKSGANYVDLATDTPVKTCILKELKQSPRWKEAGLTAVINQGGPFVMNVLVRHAADRLDRVDAIRLRFGWKKITKEKEFIPVWEPRWSPQVNLEEWEPKPVIYEKGKFKQVPQFSGVEEYKFPDPLGIVPLSFIEYEPVLTLPCFIGKGVKYVDCKITLEPVVAALHKMGFGSDRPVDVKGVKVAPKDVLLTLIPPPVESEDKVMTGEIDFLGCYLAEVQGEKAGENLTYILHTGVSSLSEVYKRFGTTWADVAVPAAVTATMLAKGQIKVKGVIPPEGLDPKPFLAKLAEAGMTFQESITREMINI
jgi:saccharopine dehydrogenase-like NADP-dependent oxidoreductase